MYTLFLILICMYTQNVSSAASSGACRQRKKGITMSLSTYNKHVAQVEYQKIIDCINTHEAKPCSHAIEYTAIHEHYIDLITKEQSSKKIPLWQKRLIQCDKRMNIMLDIEETEQKTQAKIIDTGTAAAMQEIHWLALRDTYSPKTIHYSFYNQKALLAQANYKKIILCNDIAQLLKQQSISHDDYKNICEKAEFFFGDQAEQILTQLPGGTKIAMRSITTSLATTLITEKTDIADKTIPNSLRKDAQLTKTRNKITSYVNAKHLKRSIRMATLSKLYKKIAAGSSGIEKLQATESEKYYKRLHLQITLGEYALELKKHLYSVKDFNKLKKVLIKLRNTYATFDPNYEKINYEISIFDRTLWYRLKDLDALKEANLNDTNVERRHLTDTLIERIKKENHLADITNKQTTPKEKRAAYIELLSTYDHDEAKHAFYLNKVLQLDILSEIEQTTSPELDNLTFFTENIRLRTQLAQTYEPSTPEYSNAIQELDMHKALKVYTEAYDFVQSRINQPISEKEIMYFHALVKDLYTYAQFINKTYKTTIKTDWMESKLAEYAQFMTYYETIIELQIAEKSPDNSQNRQIDLLRMIINSPITELSAKKEYLIKLITLTDDIVSKIRIIRDELLTSGTLDTNEQIHWHNELALHNITRNIRNLREKIKKADLHEQIAINKELATCYIQRAAIAKQISR